jgi:hypothetical protein
MRPTSVALAPADGVPVEIARQDAKRAGYPGERDIATRNSAGDFRNTGYDVRDEIRKIYAA